MQGWQLKTFNVCFFLSLFSVFLYRNAKITSSKLKAYSFHAEGYNKKCRQLLQIWVCRCF